MRIAREDRTKAEIDAQDRALLDRFEPFALPIAMVAVGLGGMAVPAFLLARSGLRMSRPRAIACAVTALLPLSVPLVAPVHDQVGAAGLYVALQTCLAISGFVAGRVSLLSDRVTPGFLDRTLRREPALDLADPETAEAIRDLERRDLLEWDGEPWKGIPRLAAPYRRVFG